MLQANHEIRSRLRALNIPLWMLAEKIGVHENSIIRWLRTDLGEDRRKAIEGAIQKIIETMGR